MLKWLKSFVPVQTQTVVRTVEIQGVASTQGPRPLLSGMGNYYEALKDSPDRTPIPIIANDFRAILRALNRERLAAIGNYLYDNYGAVSYAVDTIANYSVPIIPHAVTQNRNTNKLYDKYWLNWCRTADYTGRFDFNTLQRIACKSIDMHGDIGVVPTMENGFPQVQMLETWRIGSRLDQAPDIIDGVKIDKKGRILAYVINNQFNPNIPQSQLGAGVPPNLQTIPANQLYLLFDPDRYSSYRGLSPLRRGSNDIRDVQDIKAFIKLAVKIESALAGVIESDGSLEEDVWGNDTGDSAGAAPGNQPPTDATPQEKKISIAELLGGDLPVLENAKLHEITGSRAKSDTPNFLMFLAGNFVYSLGIPPAFYLDEKMTGPNSRGVNGKAQRRFDVRQTQIGGLVEWLWPRVMADGMAKNELPEEDGWQNCEWHGPAKVTIDEGRDAAADRDDNQAGLKSRQEIFSKRSLDWRSETDQSFTEDDYILERATKQASTYKVPVDVILQRWGFGPQKPQPVQQGQPNPNSPNQ